MKKAFTLIEIIFVIIIIGIISAIGSDIIFKAYENYILSQHVSEAAYKTDLAIEQIAKRLSYRIRGSESTLQFGNASHPHTLAITIKYPILQWIGYEWEARRGSYNGSFNQPGWSGFIDLSDANTSKVSVKTRGSRLDYAQKIIKALHSIDISQHNNNCAIFFPVPNADESILKDYYSSSGTTNKLRIYKGSSNDILHFEDTTSPKEIYEHYYLACSAYALVPEGNPGDYNLTLYYDYQPWMGQTYKSGKKSVLISNLTKFNFRRFDRAIELKLCARSGKGDYNTTFCSAKVVF
ncbi:hypothetical protein NitYY0826_C1560 [Nitratiruptor sp. YY08-26]|uniref:prepilin-type N-terminal cleavage/methylation domain-containing protein n=1 Tax=unclassified Nitratiruptor TaxID=2624044 RepID=UPI0019168AA8|nr:MULTISPECIES: prepilin-type N-terminal cleavage/methylation domain-containing protein [unclassified Nitratiruptor]BCD62677.1 hypothetical protein NitYY0813_C1558 [Nitratiruptor sp. YY08-13]BCD66613.1 hypothetical protein NitYY0826_C1560 [Nitratiruptor sp. YY08-26]